MFNTSVFIEVKMTVFTTPIALTTLYSDTSRSIYQWRNKPQVHNEQYSSSQS